MNRQAVGYAVAEAAARTAKHLRDEAGEPQISADEFYEWLALLDPKSDPGWPRDVAGFPADGHGVFRGMFAADRAGLLSLRKWPDARDVLRRAWRKHCPPPDVMTADEKLLAERLKRELTRQLRESGIVDLIAEGARHKFVTALANRRK
jgi:hypothetical protein